MNQKDFEKHVHEAIKWVATEHKFFDDLSVDLQLLKRDIALAQEKSEVRDIKRALGDFRYIGKAEKRFNNHEKHVEDFLNKLREHELTVSGSVHEIQQFLERLHTEAANLIKDSSFFEGKIKELLLHLRDEIKDHEIEQAQATLMEVERLIEDAEKWIAALPVDLKRAKRVVQEADVDKSADEYKDPNLEDFRNLHTLEQIKGLMATHNMYYLRIWQREENSGVSGLFGNPNKKEGGAAIQVWFDPKRKIMQIDYAQLVTNPAFSGPVFPRHYNPQRRFKYPSFKAYLTRFLEILDDAVQGKSYENVSKRLEREGIV